MNNTDINLIQLARILHELVIYEGHKAAIGDLSAVVGRAASIFNDRDNSMRTLHPDLGLELSIFATFKYEANDGAYRDYRENTLEMIEDLEKEYDIIFSPTSEPHKKEKDLTKLARVIYELVLHEEDVKVLFNFYKLSLETKGIFDTYFEDIDERRTTLGGNIEKFIDYKIGDMGDPEAVPSFSSYEALEMIERLEKQYGIAAK